jgi:hypothetical protein
MRGVSDIGATAPILHSPTHSVLAQLPEVEPLDLPSKPSHATTKSTPTIARE